MAKYLSYTKLSNIRSKTVKNVVFIMKMMNDKRRHPSRVLCWNHDDLKKNLAFAHKERDDDARVEAIKELYNEVQNDDFLTPLNTHDDDDLQINTAEVIRNDICTS